MDTVISKDGTPIAYQRSGRGSALVLIHGTTSDHSTTWKFILTSLEEHFIVYAMDRRGRGESGDGPAYSLDREAEDVAALVDSIGQPVNVLGHSYGALCAIKAALLTNNIRRLILYEGVPAITIPTLLLVGGESPSWELANAQVVASALTKSRIQILAGQ
ncbi:N-formylmaleamate deformylase [Methanosarcinales archaeon]|nr:N-formylmaleamate deformylase [Methanosarcinales archaeon]